MKTPAFIEVRWIMKPQVFCRNNVNNETQNVEEKHLKLCTVFA